MFRRLFCFVKNNSDAKKSKRNSNLELLRIVAMLMIVAHHFGVYAVGLGNSGNTLTDYYNSVFLSFGKVGVTLFMMISAYFLCGRKVEKNRIISTWIKTLVYSVTIGVFVKVFMPSLVPTGSTFLFNFLPVSTQMYWFVTAYIFVLIVSPLLNMVIEKLDKKQLRHLLLFFAIVWGVIYIFTDVQALFSGFLELMFIYLLTAYLKHYYKLKSKRYYIYAVLFLLLCHLFSMALGTFLPVPLQAKLNIIAPLHFVYSLYPVVLFLSIEIFLLFLKLKPRYNAKINYISSLTFDVYLVHEHTYMRSLFWHILFPYHATWSLVAKIPYSIIMMLMAYAFASVIGLIYKHTVFKAVEKIKLVEKTSEFLDKALVIADRRIDDEEMY